MIAAISVGQTASVRTTKTKHLEEFYGRVSGVHLGGALRYMIPELRLAGW